MKLKFIITRLYIISFTISLNTIYGACSCKTEVENNKSSSESTKKTHITKTLNNTKPTFTKPKPTSTNPEYNSTNPEYNSTNPEYNSTNQKHNSTNPKHNSTNQESNFTNPEYNSNNPKLPHIPTENNTENKLPYFKNNVNLEENKKNVDPEENKKNKLINNLYNEYTELKKILQYFFKREIQSILDLDITSIESIENIIKNNGTDFANQKLKLLLNFRNEVWRQNDPSSNSYLYYSEINENSIFALLYALCQSTAIVCRFQSIDDTRTYNIWNLIQYITNNDNNDNKDNFYNIVPFVSNRSDFFYNLCKSISDAGNLWWLKGNTSIHSWGIGFDCDILNPMYETFCKNCGSNKNDNENKIINYFSIKFYNDNREIKNNFDDDTDNKTVIDFIKYWKLDEGN